MYALQASYIADNRTRRPHLTWRCAGIEAEEAKKHQHLASPALLLHVSPTYAPMCIQDDMAAVRLFFCPVHHTCSRTDSIHICAGRIQTAAAHAPVDMVCCTDWHSSSMRFGTWRKACAVAVTQLLTESATPHANVDCGRWPGQHLENIAMLCSRLC